MGLPAAPAALGRVEDLAGTRLPEDFREFVTTIGDGAPGPYYGINSLARDVEFVEKGWGRAVLGADSPLTGDVDFVELLGGPDDWEAHAVLLDNDPAYAAGFDRLQATYLGEPWCNGRLPIADYGCGDCLFLMLRGPRRGTVWADCLSNATGLYCLEVDFLTWYTRWLDDALDLASRGDTAPDNGDYPCLRYGDNSRHRPPPNRALGGPDLGAGNDDAPRS
ncbi:SMI1/KNR4 family protein [Streptomyces sp. NPDC056441]|uniref:SMI1/KNR4 family protein n=1 Tax=Streptomyces sp. NPDC056441 TaxID=3345817 RepID=UPI00369F21C0